MARSSPALLTHAAYARHRKARGLPGGSRVAVHKAIKEGRITGFGPDNLLDVELADSQWARNTRARFSPQAAVASAAGTGTGGAGQAAGGAMAPDLVAQAAAGSAGDAVAPERSAADKPVAVDTGYSGARARREEAEADKAQMEAAKMSGAMVMRDDVDRAMFEIGRELRDRLASCARRVAAEVSSLLTAEACEVVIDREHRIVLELLVSAAREKMGAGPKAAA